MKMNMMNKLFKIWIGLFALTGALIFFHSKELNSEFQEDLFIHTPVQKIENSNSFKNAFEVAKLNKAGEKNSKCNFFRNEDKTCNHYYCNAKSENQTNNNLEIRP